MSQRPDQAEDRRVRFLGSSFVALAVSVISLFVFCSTAARELVLGRSPGLVALARTLGVADSPGYPLYTLLSAAVLRTPVGSPFFRLSALSAVLGAAAAGVVSLLTWEVASTRLTRGSRLGPIETPTPALLAGSAVAGLAFAFAPTVWMQSTVPEVHTLSALLVLGALYLVVRWRRLSDQRLVEDGPRGERLLWFGALVLGLSFAHHLTAVLVVPSVVVAVSGGRGRHATAGSAVRMLLFLAAAMTIYLYLPIRSSQEPAMLSAPIDSFESLLAHVSGAGHASWVSSESLLAVRAKLAWFFSGVPRELTWPTLSLSGVGLALLWIRSKRLFAVLVLELVLVVAHTANHRVPDAEGLYVPVYAVLAVGAGVAVACLPGLLGSTRRRTVGLTAVGLAVAALASVGVAALANLPERDLSHATGGRRYLRRLLREIPHGGVVLAQNDRTLLPLWYAVYVEGARQDMAVLNTRDTATHLQRWWPDVSLPSEQDLIAFTGGDPAVPCYPPLREKLPLAGYLPLIVTLNGNVRPIVADVDIGRDVFPKRSVPKGLLVQIGAAGPTNVRIIDDLLSLAALPASSDGGRAGPRQSDGTSEAYATTLSDLGQLLLARGMAVEGLRALEAARDLLPDAAHIRSNLSVAYRRLGRLDDAFRELARAAELAPGRASTYHNLSRLHMAAGDGDAAVSALATASRLDPKNLGYRLELASLLEARDDPDRAEDVLQWVERNAGDDLAARLAYGDFLLRQERYREAVAAYGRAQEASPSSAGVFTSLSRCYWQMEEADAAIAAMRRSVELQPHNPKLKYDLALMLQQGGRPREALRCLDDVERLLPSAWQPVALRASILTGLGMHAEARRLFERAGELGAEGEQFRAAWSALELAEGDTAAAAEIVKGR